MFSSNAITFDRLVVYLCVTGPTSPYIYNDLALTKMLEYIMTIDSPQCAQKHGVGVSICKEYEIVHFSRYTLLALR